MYLPFLRISIFEILYYTNLAVCLYEIAIIGIEKDLESGMSE